MCLPACSHPTHRLQRGGDKKEGGGGGKKRKMNKQGHKAAAKKPRGHAAVGHARMADVSKVRWGWVQGRVRGVGGKGSEIVTCHPLLVR